MKIAVVIVGINQWIEYTEPLISELQFLEPDVGIYVIDNMSDIAYPETEDVKIIRVPRCCYSAAINIGAREALKDGFDWLLSMNNDVTCCAQFSFVVDRLKPDAVYARQIIEEKGNRWFGNWIVLIPRVVWDALGGFDENFKVCGFEDADYSMRAKELGYETVPVSLPFVHYWGRTRWDVPGYPETREENINYFERKWGWRPGSEMRVTHD